MPNTLRRQWIVTETGEMRIARNNTPHLEPGSGHPIDRMYFGSSSPETPVSILTVEERIIPDELPKPKVIEFHPVIEDGKHAKRIPQVGDFFQSNKGLDMFQLLQGESRSTNYFIYRRVEREVEEKEDETAETTCLHCAGAVQIWRINPGSHWYWNCNDCSVRAGSFASKAAAIAHANRRVR